MKIGDYAFLSDCRSAALVGRNGSVDWYCVPRFDSPSVFARLLDGSAGHWWLRPEGDYDHKWCYIDDTLVLRTVFEGESGRVQLTEALALEPGSRGHEIGKRSPNVLLRRIEGLDGRVEMATEFAPRFEYGLTTPHIDGADKELVVSGGPVMLKLPTNVAMDYESGTATATFTVNAGETAEFALSYAPTYGVEEPMELDVGSALNDTIESWRSWVEIHDRYQGDHAGEVQRSALVLQGLTFQPTGAVIAAATTSLPEEVGGKLNWDYRFAWLRDLSLTMRAQWVAACPDEADRLFRFIARAGGSFAGENVQIVYGVEGERDLTERTLDHLSGWRNSKPVHVGNDAWDQVQLDVLGEVLDAACLLKDQLGDLDEEMQSFLTGLADRAAECWQQPDAGMWEARDQQRQYLSSKVMCWVALDRALKLADCLGSEADPQRWSSTREDIREAVLEQGWSHKIGAYAGAFGSDELDASVLLLPLVGFLPAGDERMRATIDVVESELGGPGLIRRWPGEESGFVICTYWLVECLALAGELERARKWFDRATSFANDLGLLAEEGDLHSHELLGNYPQAFSHVGLINAAWRLTEATSGKDTETKGAS
ncbi:MAG: glycoside hydrolase family 15 protein [Actinobacteria bacterium]|nr:glycoside hydrolase family 15 protein [Actinomycetota bacterium]